MTAPNVNWPSIENDLILNIPISQQSLYPSHNMMDNQQAHMAMMMMQQQQLQQQQLQQQQLQQQQQQQILQQQQEYMLLNQQPWFLRQQNSIQSASSVPSPMLVSMTPPAGAKESDMLLMKRVEVILTINQELIRLCLEHQQMNMNETREPDITMYKSRLQSNLTYLATMADISMTKPEENTKIPTPPNLSPLPPPYTMTGQRIHKLLFSANQLFLNEEETEMMSPYPQQQGYNKAMMMRQRQQQYSSGMNSVGSSNSSNSNYNMLSPHHLHHPLLKNNQNNVDIVQDAGNYTMDDTAMMMMMMYSLPQV